MYASEEMRRKTLMKVTSDQRRVTVGELDLRDSDVRQRKDEKGDIGEGDERSEEGDGWRIRFERR